MSLTQGLKMLSEPQLEGGYRSPAGHVCQTPNLNHLITDERVVILATTEPVEAKDTPASEARLPFSMPLPVSLPINMGKIALWGGGVAAFVALPLVVTAIVAAPLIVAGALISASTAV
jgi:hypothetical protein